MENDGEDQRTEHVTNEEVLRRIGDKRLFMHAVGERQRKWIRHTLRLDSLLKTSIEGRNEGRRQREDQDIGCWIG